MHCKILTNISANILHFVCMQLFVVPFLNDVDHDWKPITGAKSNNYLNLAPGNTVPKLRHISKHQLPHWAIFGIPSIEIHKDFVLPPTTHEILWIMICYGHDLSETFMFKGFSLDFLFFSPLDLSSPLFALPISIAYFFCLFRLCDN